MISLKILRKNRYSAKGGDTFAPTVEFEKFVTEARNAITSQVQQFDLLLIGLVEQTGSMAVARSLLLATLIAEYLELSEEDSHKRLNELVEYSNALIQIGQHMEFLRDFK